MSLSMSLLIPSLILFLISFLLVTVSSYLLASVFEPKKYGIGFLYWLLISFAQVVLTFEVLSLFQAIKVPAVLIMNMLIFAASIFFWLKKDRPLYKPQIKETAVRIFKALKRDKILMILAGGFIFLICLMIFLNIIMPVNGFDALCYHLNRAAFWASQGSLNHFDIADDRNLVMPVNSEIMYTWVLLFLKNDWALGLFSFLGYIASIVSLYNILAFFGFSERKKLWSVLILSSFSSVIAEASSIETDIILAGLILTSIFLYIYSLKERKIGLIFFSSLAYALAIGTKTPSLIAFPGVFCLLAYFSAVRMKKEFFKPLTVFLGLLFLNFLLFGSYNYILNFIDYGNFMATGSSVVIHRFWGGPKAFIANFIRYIFMMFDFSGFRYSDYVGHYITSFKFLIFDMLKIPHELGITMGKPGEVNNGLLDVKMGAGLLGFLLFLPGIIISVVSGLIKSGSKKAASLFPFGVMFLINVLVMSGTLGYMVFSIRFLTFFIVISSPVLAATFIKKNPMFKLLVLFFALSYMLVISTHLKARSFSVTLKTVLKYNNLASAREVIRCSLYSGYEGQISFCHLREKIAMFPKGSKIAILPSYDDRIYPVKAMENFGYKIDTLLTETVDKYALEDYDYIIKTNPVQVSTTIKDENRAKTDYVIKNFHVYFTSWRPSSCIYLGADSVPVTKERFMTPAYTMCRVEDDYLLKRGFKLIGIVDYQSELRENSNTMYFYENIHKSN